MKTLIISYNYYPLSNPRAIRWTLVAEELVKAEISVTLVGGPKSLSRNSSGVEVIACSSLFSRFQDAESRASIDTGPKKNSWRDHLRRLLKNFWQALRWPDYACLWIPGAVWQSYKQVRKQQPDVIIAVSHPFSSQVVGYFIKKFFPKIPLILDSGDPFSFAEYVNINNTELYSRFNRYFEEKLLRLADSLSVTTIETEKLYLEAFSFMLGKIKVIPPVLSLPLDLLKDNWTDDLGPENIVNSDKASNTLRFVYVGTLYKKLRSPNLLMRFFEFACDQWPTQKLELHFYGELNDCGEELMTWSESAMLKGKIFLHASIPNSQVFEVLKKASVLINIGNLTSYQLPSKVVDYSALALPILNFMQISADSSRAFFADYSLVSHIHSATDFDAGLKNLEAQLAQPRAQRRREAQDFSKRFTPNSLAVAYQQLFPD